MEAEEVRKTQVPTVTVWPSGAVSVNREGHDALTVSVQPDEECAAELARFLRGALADAYMTGRAEAEA